MMEKPKTKLAELVQRSFPFRTQKMELYEDRIELSVRSMLERYRIPFYLHTLREDPDIVLLIPWRTIFLSAAALLAGVALAVFGGRKLDPIVGWGLAAIGTPMLFISWMMVARLNVFFYKAMPGLDPSQACFEPQLFLYRDRPSPDEVSRFEELLGIEREKEVEKARIQREEPIPYARELERFENLRREKVVTEEEYALVKAKLLNIKPRRIGF